MAQNVDCTCGRSMNGVPEVGAGSGSSRGLHKSKAWRSSSPHGIHVASPCETHLKQASCVFGSAKQGAHQVPAAHDISDRSSMQYSQQLMQVLSVMDVTQRYLRQRVRESTRTIVEAWATDSPGRVLQAMKVRDVALAMLERGTARRRALLCTRLSSVDNYVSDEGEDFADVQHSSTDIVEKIAEVPNRDWARHQKQR